MAHPIKIPNLGAVGRRPENWVGNGQDVTSPSLEELAKSTNMIRGRRGKVLFQKSVEFTQPISDTGQSLFYGSFKTSPGPKVVTALMVCLPTSNTSATITPRLRWNFVDDPSSPGSTTSQPYVHIGPRRSTPTPSDMFTVYQKFDGTGNTTALSEETEYMCYISSDYVKVMSAVLYEEPANQYTASSPLIVSPINLGVGSPLLGPSVDSIGDTQLDIWKHQAPVLFNWGANGDAGSDDGMIYINSATYVNALNTAVTSYSANGEGWWAWPAHQGSYHSTTTVPCVFWGYAEATGTGSGNIKLITASGDLATLSFPTGGGSVFTSAAFNLDGTQDAQLLQVHARRGSTGDIRIKGFGAYQWET